MRPPHHSWRRRTAGALLATTVGFTTFALAPSAMANLEEPDPDLQVVQLVVSQVGVREASGNDVVAVSIQHINSTGEITDETSIPTQGPDGQYDFSLGANRDQQGALQRSVDGQLVAIGGYDFVADGSTNLNGSASSDIMRVIATMDAAGGVDVSTGLGYGFNERHIRGVTTVDGSGFWAGGHGNDTMQGRGDFGTKEMELHQGGVLHVEAGSAEPTPITVNPGHNNNENNARVPGIHNGQLYVTTDRGPYNGGNQVAEGLPTEPIDVPNERTTTAELPSDAETPHDFVFIDDSLYVTATEGDSAGVVRYDQNGAGAYEAVDTFEGEFWGLTGREAGDDTVLYAVEGSNFGNELVAIIDDDEDFSEAEKRTRQALVDWDANDDHREGAGAFQFERATADGYGAEGPNSLNVEGATMAPDGETLWLGFRSPLTPLDDGDTALMVAIEDIEDIVIGEAEPMISDHHYLDLGGRAIRSIAATDEGNYLITAGSADDEGNFAMFGWTGDVDDEPVQASGAAPSLAGWDGSYEGTAYVESLADGTTIRVIQDVGTLDLYGTGDEAQDLAREYAKLVSHDYVLDFDGAFEEETETPSPIPTETASMSPVPSETTTDPSYPVDTADPIAEETPVAGADDASGSGLATTGATVLAWLVLGLVLLAIGIAVVRRQRAASH